MGITNRAKRICLIPNVSGVGGMVSFRDKLVDGLSKRGIGVSFNLADFPYNTVLVIGGTKDLSGLWRAKRQGVRIVQRLDGMNWIHRRRRTGWQHFIRAESGNLILSLIRSRLADHIIYQSNFTQTWWERKYGKTRVASQVVYNGVDLERYSPSGPSKLADDHIRIILVEGTIGGGYEMGQQTAVQIGGRLHAIYSLEVEIQIVGRVSAHIQQEWKNSAEIKVNFTGPVPSKMIPELDRSAQVFYSADINPACPNSVIEALACGLPVAAFDTGALSEIITGGSGKLVAYGGDPWKLEPPDVEGLAKAMYEIINDQASYRKAARKRAEEAFGLDHMVDGYLTSLSL